MHSVRVKRRELLEKLRDNRAAHQAIFDEAIVGYRKAVIKELEKSLDDACKGKCIRRSVDLVEPMNMTKEYDRAIAMLEMETREELDITEQEFSQFVMDDWRWKDQFLMSNIGYTGRM